MCSMAARKKFTVQEALQNIFADSDSEGRDLEDESEDNMSWRNYQITRLPLPDLVQYWGCFLSSDERVKKQA